MSNNITFCWIITEGLDIQSEFLVLACMKGTNKRQGEIIVGQFRSKVIRVVGVSFGGKRPIASRESHFLFEQSPANRFGMFNTYWTLYGVVLALDLG